MDFMCEATITPQKRKLRFRTPHTLLACRHCSSRSRPSAASLSSAQSVLLSPNRRRINRKHLRGHLRGFSPVHILDVPPAFPTLQDPAHQAVTVSPVLGQSDDPL